MLRFNLTLTPPQHFLALEVYEVQYMIPKVPNQEVSLVVIAILPNEGTDAAKLKQSTLTSSSLIGLLSLIIIFRYRTDSAIHVNMKQEQRTELIFKTECRTTALRFHRNNCKQLPIIVTSVSKPILSRQLLSCLRKVCCIESQTEHVNQSLYCIRFFLRKMLGTQCGPVRARFSLILGTR